MALGAMHAADDHFCNEELTANECHTFLKGNANPNPKRHTFVRASANSLVLTPHALPNTDPNPSGSTGSEYDPLYQWLFSKEPNQRRDRFRNLDADKGPTLTLNLTLNLTLTLIGCCQRTHPGTRTTALSHTTQHLNRNPWRRRLAGHHRPPCRRAAVHGVGSGPPR